MTNLPDSYNPTIVLPEQGVLSRKFKASGIRVLILENQSWRYWVKNSREMVRAFMALPLFFKSLFSWLRLIKQEKPDLIHCNTMRLFEPVVAGRLLGIPSVNHFRDIPSKMRSRPIYDSAFWRICEFAKYWLAISNAVAEDAINSKGKAAPDCVRVIFNGLDFKKNGSNLIRKIQKEPDDFCRVAMYGGINPWKCQLDFVKAAIGLIKLNRNLYFEVVGGLVVKEYVSRLNHIIVENSAQDKIKLLGHVEESIKHMQSIDIMVHTAHFEPFGRVFIEAMVAGLPVVTYDSGGAKDIVVHNETGLLVPVGDIDALAEAIGYLARNPKIRARMGKAGRERVEKHFSIEKHVKEVTAIYDDLLPQKKGEFVVA